MRVLAIGDVGIVDDMIHIGDEAMFEEFVVQARRRSVTAVTAVSSNPPETAARYGIDAVPPIGFAPGAAVAVGAAAVGGAGAGTGAGAGAGAGTLDARAWQTDRLRRVLGAAAGERSLLRGDDPAWQVIDAVRAADAVAVTGGGNMASIWPLHIFERNAIGELARLFGKPLVVSGQTIGPPLFGEDRGLVAGLLSGAALVGLRETASYALVRELGVPMAGVSATLDDATFLGADPGSPVFSADGAATSGFDGAGASGLDGAATSGLDGAGASGSCVVTLASHVADADRAAFVAGTARLLDRIAAESGLEIVFHAHFASTVPGLERGDSVMHRSVIDQMTTPRIRIAPTTDSPASARLARGADLVVTSRYHPAVFAVSGGVPTLGIAVDDYTTVKLTGALANFGQSGVVSAADMIDGGAITRALELWAARAAVRADWSRRIPAARAASAAWWDRLAAALAP